MRRIGLVAGLAAFAATAVLAVTRDARTSSGPLGPEGVPIPAAPSAARVRRVAMAQRIDGISCQPAEAVLFHTHAHLTIFVGGAPRQVPAGIGIAPPLAVEHASAGAFVAGASCFMWLHTHAADGIIHTESPVERVYTLGDFFDVWGAPLDSRRVGDARGAVTAFVDGHVHPGDPRRIPLRAHAQIQLDVGRPLVAPDHISFPSGL